MESCILIARPVEKSISLLKNLYLSEIPFYSIPLTRISYNFPPSFSIYARNNVVISSAIAVNRIKLKDASHIYIVGKSAAQALRKKSSKHNIISCFSNVYDLLENIMTYNNKNENYTYYSGYPKTIDLVNILKKHGFSAIKELQIYRTIPVQKDKYMELFARCDGLYSSYYILIYSLNNSFLIIDHLDMNKIYIMQKNIIFICLSEKIAIQLKKNLKNSTISTIANIRIFNADTPTENHILQKLHQIYCKI